MLFELERQDTFIADIYCSVIVGSYLQFMNVSLTKSIKIKDFALTKDEMN